MKKKSPRIRIISFLAMCAAVALLLSYVETLIPPIYPAVPGIKIGLPNVIVIFLLYRFGVAEAALVSFLRVIISSMLFGTPFIFFYSLAGAFLSLAVMSVLKKLDFLTSVGVSIAGGISHNLGQILLAMVLLNTAELGYYMVVLAISGAISGTCVGLCGGIMIKRIRMKRLD